MIPRLYSYWRSSAAYRVRIALNLKGIEHEIVAVSLIADGGEHRSEGYRAMNPQGFVPFFDDGTVAIGQSQAIMEYLDEAYAGYRLLPDAIRDRTFVRAFSNAICCDIHPLNNLRVMQYLGDTLGVEDAARDAWYRHWIAAGFEALERMAGQRKGRGEFVCGDAPTMADACLVPQMYNARRFELPLDDFPRLLAADAACRELDAFRRAAPEAQTDAAPP
jgi:maleylacetoacetate isomerase